MLNSVSLRHIWVVVNEGEHRHLVVEGKMFTFIALCRLC